MVPSLYQLDDLEPFSRSQGRVQITKCCSGLRYNTPESKFVQTPNLSDVTKKQVPLLDVVVMDSVL